MVQREKLIVADEIVRIRTGALAGKEGRVVRVIQSLGYVVCHLVVSGYVGAMSYLSCELDVRG